MKKLIIFSLATLLVVPVQAQLFSRESLGGALLGGLAGGIIGHNSGRRTAEGVGIGAGAGLLLGGLLNESRTQSGYYNTQVPYPSADHGYYGSPYYSSGYSPHGSSYYSPMWGRPNYAITGAALGGLAGGIIGHNSGRQTAEGVAIGAGAGLLLGGLAEHSARRNEAYHYASPAYATPVYSTPAYGYFTPNLQSVPAASAAPAQAPTQITIINNYYGNSSPMSGANGLFGR